MKKTLLFILLSLGIAVAGRAQTPGINQAYNWDSCSAPHMFYYSTSLTGALSQYRLEHSFGDGFTDTTSFSNAQGIYVYHQYNTPGTYSAKAVLLQNNARIDSATQSINTGTCVLFSGRIFADFNSNCTYNAGADSMMLAPLLIRVDSANVPIDTVSAYGNWAYVKRSNNFIATTYKFIIINPPALFASTCQTANSISVNYPGVTSNINFGYTCSGTGFDAAVTYAPFLRTSTAGASWINGYYSNVGCTPQSGTVTFKVSPKYSINTAGVTPTPASIVGNLITWNYTNLHVGTTKTVYIPVTPTALYTTSDTACNVMTINPIAGDANPTDNVVSRCDSLRTSFDPNDKSVSPGGDVLSGSILTYHINFENLGNDTAFNIHILDTLSSNLDANSFTLLSASHAVRPSLIEKPGAPKVMKFDFPNIRLADKTKPALNKGYVRFTIRTRLGLANGTQIFNRAGIYFDFNPVVMTNTATSRVMAQTSVEVLSATLANRIHPNPATGRLTISNADGTLREALLMTATGQVARRWNLTGGENIVSIEGLPTGLYLVQLHGTAGVQVEKLEKK